MDDKLLPYVRARARLSRSPSILQGCMFRRSSASAVPEAGLSASEKSYKKGANARREHPGSAGIPGVQQRGGIGIRCIIPWCLRYPQSGVWHKSPMTVGRAWSSPGRHPLGSLRACSVMVFRVLVPNGEQGTEQALSDPRATAISAAGTRSSPFLVRQKSRNFCQTPRAGASAAAQRQCAALLSAFRQLIEFAAGQQEGADAVHFGGLRVKFLGIGTNRLDVCQLAVGRLHAAD